jgi:hypothetical protein
LQVVAYVSEKHTSPVFKAEEAMLESEGIYRGSEAGMDKEIGKFQQCFSYTGLF